MGDYSSLEIGLCWGTLQQATLVELIDAAGRHGFPTLSIRPDSVRDCLAGGMSEAGLRRRLRDAGARVRVIDALSAGLPGMEKVEGVADEAACFRAAEVVESPIINIALYGGEAAPPPQLSEAIGGVSRRAAARGLGIVLEFVPETGIPDIHAARLIAETCGEPNCRVALDPWHLARSGGTLEDVLAIPRGLIGAFQLDDRTPPPPGAIYVPMTGRDLPGEGRLPLHDITRAVLANNPALTAEIEVFSAELRRLSVDQAAQRVAEAVRRWRADL